MIIDTDRIAMTKEEIVYLKQKDRVYIVFAPGNKTGYYRSNGYYRIVEKRIDSIKVQTNNIFVDTLYFKEYGENYLIYKSEESFCNDNIVPDRYGGINQNKYEIKYNEETKHYEIWQHVFKKKRVATTYDHAVCLIKSYLEK